MAEKTSWAYGVLGRSCFYKVRPGFVIAGLAAAHQDLIFPAGRAVNDWRVPIAGKHNTCLPPKPRGASRAQQNCARPARGTPATNSQCGALPMLPRIRNAYMPRTAVEFGMSFTLVARITKPQEQIAAGPGRRHTPELDELFAPTPDSYPLPRAILVGAGGASCTIGMITRVQNRLSAAP